MKRFTILLTALVTQIAHGQVHVDSSSPGPLHDGLSWATAFLTIQAGIAAAASSEAEVWVADGVYPETVTMASSVEVYGGFEGHGGLEETDRAERDIVAHVTQIDARTADAGSPADHTVVFGAITGARLDGFTITGGVADGPPPDADGGGVIFVGTDASNTLVSCLIVDNSATEYGGGMFLDASAPRITGCVITGNVANRGGGVAAINASSPEIDHCQFRGNHALSFGGGVGMAYDSSPSVSNTVISGNTSTLSGAGIYAVVSSNPDFTNCIVRGNFPGTEGGGAWINFDSDPVFTNLIFVGNPSQSIHENDTACDPLVSFCLFDDNPDGDYWNENTELLTGAASMETLAEVTDILDNPLSLPIFRPSVTGSWTETPVHDPLANRTVLVDASAEFASGDLVGRWVVTNTAAGLESLIVANTAVSLEVVGDVTSIPASAAQGTSFEIMDHRLAAGSPAIDSATAVGAPADDLLGTPRPQALGFDIGALEAQARITAAPASIDFGVRDVDDGPSSEEIVAILNEGEASLTFTGSGVSLAGVGSPEFSIASDTGEALLAAGASREVRVTFDPTALGSHVASLEIACDDLGNPHISIPLSGFGVSREIALSVTSLDFEAWDIDEGATSSMAAVITNEGTGPLTVNTVDLAGPASAEFVITLDTGETTLPAGASREVWIAFDPLTVGTKTASLEIESNDTDESLLTAALSGVGVDQELNALPRDLDFEARDIDLGQTAPLSVTISNVGTASHEIDSVTLVGPGSPEFGVTLDTGETLLAPGASREVRIAFDPITVGPHAASLEIVCVNPGEPPITVGLTGVGVDQEIDISPLSIDFAFRDIDADQASAETIVIENIGSNDLTILSATLGGPGLPDLSILSDSGEALLAPGQSREITVTFDPITLGPRSAEIVVTSDDTDESLIRVPLLGTGSDQEITLEPASLEFGLWDLDDGPIAQPLAVFNEGTAPLSFIGPGLTLSGAQSPEFAVTGDPSSASIAAGASREVWVLFDPETMGDFSALLAIQTDDTDEPEIEVPLVGVGYQRTSDLVEMILDLQSRSPSPEQWDVNGDGALDAADVSRNVNTLSIP
jgi:parallel beta-helix repeat protein